ncbi:MAG: bifunctional 4-hydroxy-2-oxoglutarate aldolase/2-dehydro-3-deoxy-phosphogluconate aldolase [Paracoccaceae bacterium]|nr:bifunctional 4-hydroxy-2-oxoglutarate aldolase/2-dehydro-3-deoxy-phosphogluconate aldolase [Paracoccaceae bacterium]MDE2911669.1 bifunctional 4-hydroxy-2-oxoglutarate aldolase/2-dehydro-3-deoxy-phosphogluconate aldolase [Paracoccaceae bacterium]
MSDLLPLPPSERKPTIESICRLSPVIAVVTIRELKSACWLAEALVAGGLPVVEVTLRSPEALDAIRAMSAVEGVVVGAGTIVSPGQVEAVLDAGATFGVSPGSTPAILDACDANGLPFMPGVATSTEVLAMQSRGHRILKFFPAESAGGRTMVKAFHAPFPDIRFCPTGGLTESNTPHYLELPNVICTGGSWVAPEPLVRARDRDGIVRLARMARELGNGPQ